MRSIRSGARCHFTGAVVLVAGAVFFVAGAGKLALALDSWYLHESAGNVLGPLAIGLAEILLGAWLAMNFRASLSLWVSTATFLALSAASTLYFVSGVDCGCLSAVRVSTKQVMLLDWLLTGSLAVGLFLRPRASTASVRYAQPVGLAIMAAVIFVAFIHGASRLAVAEVVGRENVKVGQLALSRDTIASSQVAGDKEPSPVVNGGVSVANPSLEPITILFVDGKCSVAALADREIRLAPRSVVTIPVVVRREVARAREIPFKIYTEVGNELQVDLVTARSSSASGWQAWF